MTFLPTRLCPKSKELVVCKNDSMFTIETFRRVCMTGSSIPLLSLIG